MNFLVAILAVWTVVKVSDGDTVWVKDGGYRGQGVLVLKAEPHGDKDHFMENRGESYLTKMFNAVAHNQVETK